MPSCCTLVFNGPRQDACSTLRFRVHLNAFLPRFLFLPPATSKADLIHPPRLHHHSHLTIFKFNRAAIVRPLQGQRRHSRHCKLEGPVPGLSIPLCHVRHSSNQLFHLPPDTQVEVVRSAVIFAWMSHRLGGGG